MNHDLSNGRIGRCAITNKIWIASTNPNNNAEISCIFVAISNNRKEITLAKKRSLITPETKMKAPRIANIRKEDFCDEKAIAVFFRLYSER